mmetsp:Transcript_12594/g.39732  ORF Transcript_12594/g.39732 Transcript_12594/m.39732 type:complete len:442 (-) Transcript_12594:1124-2449(-)
MEEELLLLWAHALERQDALAPAAALGVALLHQPDLLPRVLKEALGGLAVLIPVVVVEVVRVVQPLRGVAQKHHKLRARPVGGADEVGQLEVHPRRLHRLRVELAPGLEAPPDAIPLLHLLPRVPLHASLPALCEEVLVREVGPLRVRPVVGERAGRAVERDQPRGVLRDLGGGAVVQLHQLLEIPRHLDPEVEGWVPRLDHIGVLHHAAKEVAGAALKHPREVHQREAAYPSPLLPARVLVPLQEPLRGVLEEARGVRVDGGAQGLHVIDLGAWLPQLPRGGQVKERVVPVTRVTPCPGDPLLGHINLLDVDVLRARAGLLPLILLLRDGARARALLWCMGIFILINFGGIDFRCAQAIDAVHAISHGPRSCRRRCRALQGRMARVRELPCDHLEGSPEYHEEQSRHREDNEASPRALPHGWHRYWVDAESPREVGACGVT